MSGKQQKNRGTKMHLQLAIISGCLIFLAAIGVVQMQKIEDLNQARREKSHKLSDLLSEVQWIDTPTELQNRTHVYQTYSIIVDDHINRTDFINYLKNKGIGASVHFDPPIHKQKYYKENYGY
ncbi:MAG: DegT/DnrJ/EryC1/StrS family aminotransferase [Balneolaceae bacterium]|nr:DegT/DnrJ/EryC1/StrS family aminotransferase [Balneolaceae bacterium]